MLTAEVLNKPSGKRFVPKPRSHSPERIVCRHDEKESQQQEGDPLFVELFDEKCVVCNLNALLG